MICKEQFVLPEKMIKKFFYYFYQGDKISIQPHHGIDDGQMKDIGTKSFSQMFQEEVGRLPGASSRRDPCKSLLKTNANTRAKQQFEYWVKEPQPLKYGTKQYTFSYV